jgi:hypothetical protein
MSPSGGYGERAGDNVRGTYTIANNTWEFDYLPKYIFKCSAGFIRESKKVLLVYGKAPAYMYDPATDQYDDLSSAYSGEDLAAGSVFYNDQSRVNKILVALVSTCTTSPAMSGRHSPQNCPCH